MIFAEHVIFAETVLYAGITWCVMLAAFFLHRRRRVHVPVMATIMTLDVLFPFYLYMTKDWGRRLFDEGEILSFLLWCHLLLVITLYVLYVVQVQAGLRLVRGDEEARGDHRAQGIGVLITRGLVVLTGAMLVESKHEFSE